MYNCGVCVWVREREITVTEWNNFKDKIGYLNSLMF